jgi:AcrR family transcriptional regulator
MAAEEKLNEVLNASLKCFGRYGYKKTTMEDIASEIGLTKGALYTYASSKEDLYHQAVASALSRWQNRVREAVEKDNSPLDMFETMSFKAFQYLTEDQALRQVLIDNPDIFPMFGEQDPFAEINEKSRDILRSIIEQGIAENIFRPLNIDAVTWLLFSIYKMFIIDTYIVSGQEKTEKLFRDSVDLVLKGLLR